MRNLTSFYLPPDRWPLAPAFFTTGKIAATDCTSDNRIPTTAVIFACVAVSFICNAGNSPSRLPCAATIALLN